MQWIHVDDRLPAVDQYVLVTCEEYNKHHYAIAALEHNGDWSGYEGRVLGGVRFWAVLPEMPAEVFVEDYKYEQRD